MIPSDVSECLRYKSDQSFLTKGKNVACVFISICTEEVKTVMYFFELAGRGVMLLIFSMFSSISTFFCFFFFFSFFRSALRQPVIV